MFKQKLIYITACVPLFHYARSLALQHTFHWRLYTLFNWCYRCLVIRIPNKSTLHIHIGSMFFKYSKSHYSFWQLCGSSKPMNKKLNRICKIVIPSLLLSDSLRKRHYIIVPLSNLTDIKLNGCFVVFYSRCLVTYIHTYSLSRSIMQYI